MGALSINLSMRLGVVAYAYNPIYSKGRETRRAWLKASRDKKLARLYLNKQAWCGNAHL
jgi:hypothetical protein